MATGLLHQGMAQPQGGPPPSPQEHPGQSPQQPDQGGGDPRVDMDPEAGGQQRDQLVNAMLESLYGPMLDQVSAIFQQQAEEPVEAIGRIVSHLMLTTYQALADNGATAPPGVMVQAGMIAAQAVGEIGIRMGVIDEQDGDTIEAGFMLAMAKFGQAAAPDMPPKQKQRYADLIRGLRDAKSGGQGGERQAEPQPGLPVQGGA